ncbi:hypothetical protein [Streptomyces sp. KN37]|uniref:hypothetical protein n=1 Tax=Streptomyces sp. KN37 TaxID=3090667 RepID=UPI002A763B53|nr:hypothetical protein [Streptomyces sp. KN37]WPO76700.1 hypothetical protein R9806_39425 [Streptomyces sp. KN37]
MRAIGPSRSADGMAALEGTPFSWAARSVSWTAYGCAAARTAALRRRSSSVAVWTIEQWWAFSGELPGAAPPQA